MTKPQAVLIESLTEGEGRLTVKQTGKDIHITATGQDALDALRRVFPDFTGDEPDIFHFKSFKADDDRWMGNVYYENARIGGVQLLVRDKSGHAEVRVDPTDYRAKLKSEEHIYPAMGLRKAPRILMLRAFGVWLKGVLDGSNGKMREFAKKERKRPGRGSPAQTKAVARIKKIVDEETYDLKEFKREKGGESSDAIYTIRDKKWHDRENAMLWIRPGGAMSLTLNSTKQFKGKASWAELENTFGVREPSQSEDFEAVMDILSKKGRKVPEVIAKREQVRAIWNKSGWSDRDAITRQLLKVLKDNGTKVKRDKRKRYVAESQVPEFVGSLRRHWDRLLGEAPGDDGAKRAKKLINIRQKEQEKIAKSRISHADKIAGIRQATRDAQQAALVSEAISETKRVWRFPLTADEFNSHLLNVLAHKKGFTKMRNSRNAFAADRCCEACGKVLKTTTKVTRVELKDTVLELGPTCGKHMPEVAKDIADWPR